jgi:Ca-activated chloride channel homolog
MKFRIFSLVLGLVFGVLAQGPLIAQTTDEESSNTLFILDASGSMWGQIDGTAKITIAKEVMEELVRELPDGRRIGLIAYGHRREGDCNDVQTLVQLGDNNKQAVLDAVSALNAVGKTPLSLSVQQAIDALRSEDQPSTIVLVSDGIESCGGDACLLVEEARAAGVDFVMHTIGFGLSDNDAEQLRCMARAGGGEYFQADNGEQLLEATRQALLPVGTLNITVTVNNEASDFLYRVEDAATDLVVEENTLPSPPGHPILLGEGQYRVFVRPGGINGAQEKVLEDISITVGETVSRTISFDKGRLNLTVTINGQPVHAMVHVEDPQTRAWFYESSVFGTDTPVSVDLPAGKIDIEVQAGGDTYPAKRAEGVQISAGEAVDLTIAVDENSAAATDTASPGGMEMDTDRPGGCDYSHIIPSAADPEVCRNACQNDRRCRAWTYVRPDTVQGPQANCWLKESVPPAVPNECCVSGVK